MAMLILKIAFGDLFQLFGISKLLILHQKLAL